MSLSPEEVIRISHLARLATHEQEVAKNALELSHILTLAAQMDQIDTSDIEPMAHPIPTSQRLRDDVITEPNQREQFQKIAPHVEAGLYLVPQVIE